MAGKFTKILGKNVIFNNVTPEVYRSYGFPGADDLGNMFQFKRDFNDDFTRIRSVEISRGLNAELQSFDKWVAENASRIPVE